MVLMFLRGLSSVKTGSSSTKQYLGQHLLWKVYLKKVSPCSCVVCCTPDSECCALGGSQFWKQPVHPIPSHPLLGHTLPALAAVAWAASCWPVASEVSAMAIFSACFPAGHKIGCTNRREMLIQFKQAEINLLLWTSVWLVCMNVSVSHLENI